MNVVIVTEQAERDEMNRALDGHLLYSDGKITKDEFLRDYPRKVWIDTELCKSYDAELPFQVVDNREGNCWCESFATLDGAVLYATDVHTTPSCREEWDYMGSLRDGGDIVNRIPEEPW